MKLEIDKIKIDQQAINPSLDIKINIEYYYQVEIPQLVQGRIFTNDGKAISDLVFCKIREEQSLELKAFTGSDREKRRREKDINNFWTSLIVPLSKRAIEHIENLRETDAQNRVELKIELIAQFSESPIIYGSEEGAVFECLKSMSFNRAITIEQSDWVNNFAPYLGIGKFLLLELEIPSRREVPEFWKELYSKLNTNLMNMEACLRDGDWQKTVFIARKFYENAKIGDNKPGHQGFKQKFTDLMKKDHHSDESIQNLYNGIWQFFEFTSKYIHDKDKLGNILPKSIINKEDAYFVHTLSVALLNLIGAKVSRNR